MKRTIYEAEHEAFRQTVKDYIERELVPNSEKWETERLVDRSAYTAAGKYGLSGFNMPEEFGGGGSDDFRFNAIVAEEFASLAERGYDPLFGARPLRRVIQEKLEDAIADSIFDQPEVKAFQAVLEENEIKIIKA